MGLNIEYIEGQTPIDEDEKIDLKISGIVTKAELDEWEQLNIEEAIKWSLNLKAPWDEIIREKFIRQLHQKMFGKVWKWAGEFRKTNKNIGVDKFQIGLELRQLCDDFKYWHLNDIYTPDERAIRFKHRIVQIHCFPNGNGRHSRLIADIIISKIYGESVFSWGNSFDLTHASDIRHTYLLSLRNADQGDFNSLISFARS